MLLSGLGIQAANGATKQEMNRLAAPASRLMPLNKHPAQAH
jgi:hypothetical protein